MAKIKMARASVTANPQDAKLKMKSVKEGIEDYRAAAAKGSKAAKEMLVSAEESLLGIKQQIVLNRWEGLLTEKEEWEVKLRLLEDNPGNRTLSIKLGVGCHICGSMEDNPTGWECPDCGTI